MSVIENMDSEHRIMYRLFRENTRFLNGTHVKVKKQILFF